MGFLCRFPMASLSKFSICLSDQHLQHSPLMGHITSIVDQRLSSIDDARLVMRRIRSNNKYLIKYKYLILTLVMFSQDPNYTDDQHVVPGVSPASGCPD